MHSRDKAGVGLGASAGGNEDGLRWDVEGAVNRALVEQFKHSDATRCVRHYVDDNGDPHIEQLNHQEMFVEEYQEMFVEEYSKKWVASYTSKVVHELEMAKSLTGYKQLTAACEAASALLQQYHRDLHVPYDQRDVARREVLELQKEVTRLRKNLAAMVVVPLIDDLKMARGAAAACNLYGAVRAIDRAIEAL